MQNYKISTESIEQLDAVQRKAFELGYGRDIKNLFNSVKCLFLYEDGRMTVDTNRGSYFEAHRNPEISVEDFLSLGLNSNNQQNNKNMSEIKMKCIKVPKKSKNITEGEEYEGIFINAENEQVDALSEAEFFLCVNNAGSEARYKIDLFELSEPPKPGIEYLRQNLRIRTNGSILALPDGRDLNLSFGLQNYNHSGVNCSCGIQSVNGMNNVVGGINRDLASIMNVLSEDTNQDEVARYIFKSVTLAKISGIGSTGIFLFSNTQRSSEAYGIDTVMDELGAHSEWTNNPNSGNIIKAWLLDVNALRAAGIL